ncbi:2-isopropylmalate synthase [Streptomyces uncialis]|uniref:2-isopropylmalate synthase n=1 Tax=Streptomyces uncialis TaxID=1048205 RepID=UPI0038683762
MSTPPVPVTEPAVNRAVPPASWNRQRPGPMPYHRYRPHHTRVRVTAEHAPAGERAWPSARTERAPLWAPVDLRDGNQALAEPMDTPRKRRFFELLVAMGFKEIEVGYPSASRTDHDFMRWLTAEAARGELPDDVTPVVFTPARPELIDRTFESLAGLPRAVVHLYIPTSPVWRDVVLGRDRAQVSETALAAATRMARLAGALPGADIRFQFSPETFNLTEPDYVLELCDRLTALWDASPERPVTHNLPATVEIATPNVYADQIEYLHRQLARRDSVILSVHPHNDRGTGVACAELAVLAGAQRVEGCLFGNGERTGNVDLVTLALNLYAQGVDPMVDLSRIDAVRRVVEDCNRIPVHPRHPYAGDLVYTAFSGTHQDAIAKGLAHHAERAAAAGVDPGDAPWEVPYLPIDPADVGRDYEAVIRVNSQSGKGGAAYLLRTRHGLDLPRRMRPDFSREVQSMTDTSGCEASPKELYDLFAATYLLAPSRRAAGTRGIVLGVWSAGRDADGTHRFHCELDTGGGPVRYEGTGDGPLAAFVDALHRAGTGTEILDFTEHALTSGATATGGAAVAYAECRTAGVTRWGAGRDTSVLTASVHAVLAAVNRASVTG